MPNYKITFTEKIEWTTVVEAKSATEAEELFWEEHKTDTNELCVSHVEEN